MNVRRSSDTAAPLQVWVAALALVALVFWATFDDYLDNAATEHAAENRVQLARIAELAREIAEGPPKLDVIALGDSALRNATYFDDQMVEFSREIGGPELRFLRISYARASIHDHLGLLDAAIAARPDLLLIQAWIVPDRSDAKQRARHDDYRAGRPIDYDAPREVHRRRLLSGQETQQHQIYLARRLFERLGAWIAPGAGFGNRFARHQRAYLCYKHEASRVIEKHRLRYQAGRSLDARGKSSIDLLLLRAEAAGVKVVFFDLPKSSELEATPGVVHKVAAQVRFFHSLADRPALEYWPFELEIADDGFCDPVHMGRSGRRVFATWLIERIAATRADGNAR